MAAMAAQASVAACGSFSAASCSAPATAARHVASVRPGHVSMLQKLESARLPASGCHVAGRSSAFLGGESDLFSASGLDVAGPARIAMAVPKKKMSRTKTKIRKAIWLGQGRVAAEKAYSLAKAVLSKRSTSFIFKEEEEEDDKKAEEEESS